jgi:hypothetical protein
MELEGVVTLIPETVGIVALLPLEVLRAECLIVPWSLREEIRQEAQKTFQKTCAPSWWKEGYVC